MKQAQSRKKVILASAAAVVIVGAGIITGTSLATAKAPSAQDVATNAQPFAFPQNESGQTYGSRLDARSHANTPDLISAYATNGKLGYVLRTDFQDPTPRNPQEAISSNGKGAREIPVYAVDGKTQIGVFEIQNPEPATAG